MYILYLYNTLILSEKYKFIYICQRYKYMLIFMIYAARAHALSYPSHSSARRRTTHSSYPPSVSSSPPSHRHREGKTSGWCWSGAVVTRRTRVGWRSWGSSHGGSTLKTSWSSDSMCPLMRSRRPSLRLRSDCTPCGTNTLALVTCLLYFSIYFIPSYILT